jgi:hypothetical protein
LEQRSIATAVFIQQVDELFDSFNGSQKTAPDGKPLKCSIKENGPHETYWNPQTGWMTSLRAMPLIWDYVRKKGLTYLRGRSLNQDSLKNLFGVIRGGCGSSDNPTATQFIASLKTQVLNGLTNQNLSGTNCVDDQHHLLSNLVSFVTTHKEPTTSADLDLQHLGVAPMQIRFAGKNCR